MKRASSDRDVTWSEAQDDWLPIARAVFRFSIQHPHRPRRSGTPNLNFPSVLDHFKVAEEETRIEAHYAASETDPDEPMSCHNLERELSKRAGACRAEINVDDAHFKLFFDSHSDGSALVTLAPWHLNSQEQPVEIDLRIELEALFNKGNGLVLLGDQEAKRNAQQSEAARAAASFVWNQLMLPAFCRLASAGKVKIFARVEVRRARLEELPRDLWPQITLDDWQHGTAYDADRTWYYSIHAADSLPKVSARQVSTFDAETAATVALAAQLRRNPDWSRSQASHWCIENGHHFPVAARPFLYRVWPDARNKAGLPKLAPAGRKKSKH